MGINTISQNGSTFVRPEIANINDLAGKAPEPKKPEPVEFAKAEIKTPERVVLEIEKTEPAKVEPKTEAIEAVANYNINAQGDDLTITETGSQSARLGGTVKAVEENGSVAKKDTIEISYTTEAGIKLKEQLQEIRESKAKAIEEAVDELKAQDTAVNERQKYMIESNASATLANPDYISEEAKSIKTADDEIV